MPDNSVEYYRRREQQERALAEKAIDPTIGSIHDEMARRYSVLAEQGQPKAYLSLVRPS
jgi:hypothetical protein